jgi:transposase
VIRQDPLNGHLFVFLNRRRNRIKLLVWDRTGYLLLYKRLERGTFHLPTQPPAGQRHVELDAGDLGLMLEGVDLRGAHRRERWRRLPHEQGVASAAIP